MFVNKTKFVYVLRIYTCQSKLYETIFSGITYFRKEDD